METSPREIEKQLEALIKWREGCRIILETKHQKQRASFESFCNSECQIEEIDDDKEDAANDAQSQLNRSEESVPELSKQTSGYMTDFKTDLEVKDYQLVQKPPKKYLRRGEGIKQRFKIEPDAFNLEKLPPYKFANAHPNLRNPNKPGKPRKPAAAVPKNKKKAPPAASAPPPIDTKLDAQEQHFQRLLFEAKTTANSTPDSKSLGGKSTSKLSIATKSIISVENVDVENHPRSPRSFESRSTNSLPTSIAWAKVLDPCNIKPIEVSEYRKQSVQQANYSNNPMDETDDENLNIFELLEEKAKEGSFNMNSSVIKRVFKEKVAKKRNEEQDSDIIPVTTEIKESKIGHKVTVNVELNSSDSDSEAEESDDSKDSDDDVDEGGESVVEEIAVDCEETKESNDGNKEISKEGKENGKITPQLHVHFVDETQNETQDDSGAGGDTLKPDDWSEMNTEMFFEQAKKLLLEAMTHNQHQDTTAISDTSQQKVEEIKKLAEQSKQRLAELEHQIALMRENNHELLRAKQQHEMEKVAFMQQQEEAVEQLNDERVKMEIQLHDERMKLEDERRKMDEKLRMQKTAIISSERKEIVKLKEQVAILQAKLRDKEQAHVIAQGRIRAQLRCVEKEQKDLYAEVERLRKENAKLEKHNAQLLREQNKNMLNEINRKIVKLSETKSTTVLPSEKQSNQTSAMDATKKSQSARTIRKKSSIDNNKEVEKVIKITTTSFANMLSNIKNVENIEDIENVNADDEEEDDVEEFLKPNDDAQTVAEEPKIEDTKEITDKENDDADATTSSFKVLTRETINEDGGKEILYPNGTIRKESADGTIIRMMYFNGDVKETNVNEGTIKYYYSKTNTWHTTYLDGLEILEFPNGQIEHRKPNGTVEIHFPNNSIKIVDPKDKDKSAEWRFHDGSILHEMRNGDRVLMLTNGQKELHTKQFKRREYPDGTVKTVFPDGSYETRYSNGRIRLKDKDGNLIVDSEMQSEGGN